jgi:2-iminobutanoate/2-iminopropanoate deaminase
MKVVSTVLAPKAIGPYSQGIIAEGMVFTAGQIGIDPSSGELLSGVEAQAERALINLAAILEEAGSSLSQVIKTTVFVQDIGDFQTVNAIYAQAFGDHRPARSLVQAAALPAGALVEIEAVGALG